MMHGRKNIKMILVSDTEDGISKFFSLNINLNNACIHIYIYIYIYELNETGVFFLFLKFYKLLLLAKYLSYHSVINPLV